MQCRECGVDFTTIGQSANAVENGASPALDRARAT